MSDYDKGMQHALSGSEKPNTPNVTSEENDSRRDYYNEMIKRAADGYLNEWSGKDSAETKQAFAEYGKQVDDLVTQRDAYNRAAMGVDTSTAGGENAGGGGSKSVSLSADGSQVMNVRLDDDTQSVFGDVGPQSEEDRLKKEVEDTFASIQAMSDDEKIAFIQSDAGKAYRQSLEALKDQIDPLLYADFSNELFGESATNTAGQPGVEMADFILDGVGDIDVSELAVEPGTQEPEEKKPSTPTQSLLDDMFNAGGKGLERTNAKRTETIDNILINELKDLYVSGSVNILDKPFETGNVPEWVDNAMELLALVASGATELPVLLGDSPPNKPGFAFLVEITSTTAAGDPKDELSQYVNVEIYEDGTYFLRTIGGEIPYDNINQSTTGEPIKEATEDEIDGMLSDVFADFYQSGTATVISGPIEHEALPGVIDPTMNLIGQFGDVMSGTNIIPGDSPPNMASTTYVIEAVIAPGGNSPLTEKIFLEIYENGLYCARRGNGHVEWGTLNN